MTSLTTQQIAEELAQHATEHILIAVGSNGGPEKLSAYMLSIRHSLAAWCLYEAKDGQLLDIWEKHRPDVARN